MSELSLFLACVFACYRLTVLVTYDNGPYRVFLIFRTWLGRKASSSNLWFNVAELFHCPYCLGIWIALILAVWLYVYTWPLYWLAIAGGQTVLNRMIGPNGSDDEEAS